MFVETLVSLTGRLTGVCVSSFNHTAKRKKTTYTTYQSHDVNGQKQWKTVKSTRIKSKTVNYSNHTAVFEPVDFTVVPGLLSILINSQCSII